MAKIPPRYGKADPAEGSPKAPEAPKLTLGLSPSSPGAASKPRFHPRTASEGPGTQSTEKRPPTAAAGEAACDISPDPDVAAGPYLRSDEVLPGIRRFLKSPVPVFLALILTLGFGLVSARIAWTLGADNGRQSLLREQSKETAQAPDATLQAISQAIRALNSGQAATASESLQQIEVSSPNIGGLTYLVALAAFRSGNTALAETKARESLSKRERSSDAIALLALIEAAGAKSSAAQKFGDPLLRAEYLLRQAMRADVANPLPMIELSANLRQQKRFQEARDLLQAVSSFVQPVDTILFVNITARLADLQGTPTSELPAISPDGKGPESGFPDAYILMRQGKFDQAASILQSLRQSMDPRLFRYLINDQAIREFSSQPPLQPLFR